MSPRNAPGVSLVLVLVFTVGANVHTIEAQRFANIIGQPCSMNDVQGSTGICKFIADCAAAIAYLRAGIEPTVVARLKNVAVVCCPTERRISAKKCDGYATILSQDSSVRPLLPTSELLMTPTSAPQVAKCGLKELTFIVGGRDAHLGEFPYMAAIGYGPNGQSGFKCGGTLISEKFVISAAHCVSASNRPTVALLGETLLNGSVTTRGLSRIKNIIIHEDRKNPLKYNDIALFELEKAVKFSRYIRPACLPQPEDRLENTLHMTTAGWGYTEGGSGEGSNNLKTVNLTRLTQKDCEIAFNDKLERNVTYPKGILRSQFCAGHPAGTGDTCNGDSGGPMTVKKDKQDCNSYIMGITSFGSRACGGDEPGVYTNVLSFVDWIESKVWPGQY